jgi:hypothetical protein
VTPDTAETAPLPAHLAGDPAAADANPRPLLKQPLIVIPLFLLTIAALVAPFVWPTTSAEEYYERAHGLLESDNPDNWEIAFEQHLDPLSRKYPDRYVDEIAAARAKLKDRRDLKRAVVEGARVDVRQKSDAEWAYQRGLRLAQAGDTEGARRLWKAVEVVFGRVESEARWVNLARAGLTALDRPENVNSHGPPDRAAIERAAEQAKALAAAGKKAEAAAIFRALQEIYRDDPSASEAIARARAGP